MTARNADGMPEEGGPAPQGLSIEDRHVLAHLNKKLQLIDDRVVGVCLSYQTGLIVTGRGGIAKSWTIIKALERLNQDYRLHNSYLTPRKLFDYLEAAPDAVHVFEDVEKMLRDQVSVGLLRSATWGSRRDDAGRQLRLISWGAHNASRETVFGGGIVILANRKLGDLPELRALATRVPYHELPVTNREIAALMRFVALDGYRRGDDQLDVAECGEVAEFIIYHSTRLGRDLDMRLLVNSFADRLQAEDHQSGLSWQDLVLSQVCGRPMVQGSVESASIRVSKLSQELDAAREIVALPPAERVKVWWEKTRLSRATLYRRLRRLAEVDSIDFDS